ncbi:MAG TPA: Spy/CpxP family protein refolding chaperone [Vicinamibacterales bacterium]|nr:Spy/CpxP family protein refolding chaperone [Vicinamibacterales bacterium]
MTTRFKTSLAAVVAVAAIATAAPMITAQDQPQQRRQGPGFGGPPPGGPGMRGGGPMGAGPMGFGPGFRGLDLSDDQRAQLKTIAESHRAEFEAAGKKVGAARESMRALVEADSINEGAIRAKSAEIAAAEADLLILNAKVRQESMQVLTAEQLAKLKEQRDSRKGPRQRKPGGRH